MFSNITSDLKIRPRVEFVKDNLILYLNFYGDSYLDKTIYDETVYDYTRTLRVENERAITCLIEETLSIEINNYFVDEIDINGFTGKVNLVGISIDFRDPEFPYMFDGLFFVTLRCTSGTNVKDLNFQFAGGYDLFNNLTRFGLSRAIVVMHQLDKVNTVVITRSNDIQLIYPTPKGDRKSVISERNNRLPETLPSDNLVQHDNVIDVGTRGYIYVAVNDYITVIKIGRSINAEERVNQLSRSTSVPSDFKLAYKKQFRNVARAERYIHQILENKGLRVSNKEFFNLDLEKAIEIIESIDVNFK